MSQQIVQNSKLLDGFSLMRRERTYFRKVDICARLADLWLESPEFRYSVKANFTLQMSLSGDSCNADKHFRIRRESCVETVNQ